MGGRGGGGDRESESEKIFWGGSHWQIRLGGGGGGGGGTGLEKSLKI